MIRTVAFVAVTARCLSAQSVLLQMQPRPVGEPVAVSTVAFQQFTDVIETSGGMLVNDARGRRVLFLDGALRLQRALLDSASGEGERYGEFDRRLFPYSGDSLFLSDPTAVALQVLDGTGRVVRTTAFPRPSEIAVLVGGASPGVDGARRLYYRIGAARGARPGGLAAGERPAVPLPGPDSAFVIRVHLDTRAVDTVASIRVRSWPALVRFDDSASTVIVRNVNPLMVMDDWVIRSDGALVLLRGADFGVDVVRPDGSRDRTKVQFEWQRLPEEERAALIARLEREQVDRLARERASRTANLTPREAGQAVRRAQAGELAVPGVQYEFVPAAAMSDYLPPFIAGSARADARNRVWIRVLIPTTTDPVYDVIDGSGRRADRVVLPQGRELVAVGRESLYASVRDGATLRLERYAIP